MSKLPIGLVREIFEIAVSGDRLSALRLVVVSKAVQHWIDPLLYQAVHLLDKDACDTFICTISTKGRQFMARHVKTLNVRLPVTLKSDAAENFQLIVRVCEGVESLCYTGSSSTSAPTVLQWLDTTKLRPRHLCLGTGYPPPTTKIYDAANDQLSPFYRGISHLELDDTWAWLYWASNVHMLPNLTHLAFCPILSDVADTSDTLVTWIKSMLASDFLQVLVLLPRGFDFAMGYEKRVRSLETCVRVNDPRLVVILHYVDPPSRWAAEERDEGLRLWDRAERVVRKHLCGSEE
ncbi:hypothetical protein BJ138DRAFT_1099791 [Hygrophoropsis aurantiaca]|uniref:Uncharacterized protein n=1 Tax=Hygrophoropsis aurantiaca TaxID=72124 RepID=A0ACB8AIN6_9AGAM|nr:hypothetical protein BJ138DRAFT_1099791 [Hygrophoropsis aurantiaca]